MLGIIIDIRHKFQPSIQAVGEYCVKCEEGSRSRPKNKTPNYSQCIENSPKSTENKLEKSEKSFLNKIADICWMYEYENAGYPQRSRHNKWIIFFSTWMWYFNTNIAENIANLKSEIFFILRQIDSRNIYSPFQWFWEFPVVIWGNACVIEKDINSLRKVIEVKLQLLTPLQWTCDWFWMREIILHQ